MLEYKDELLGVYEVKHFLKNKNGKSISNQYVNELVEKGKLNPVARLRCGKIFLKSEIERFKDSRER